MRAHVSSLAVLFGLWAMVAQAQPGTPPPPPEVLAAPEPVPGQELPAEVAELAALLQEMGVQEDEAQMMAVLLGDPTGDMAQMLPLFMMMGGHDGGNAGDVMGMLLLMKMMTGAAGGAATATVREGDYLFLVDNGVLYKINTTTMQVEGQVAYRRGPTLASRLRMLQPIFAGAREKAEQATCMSNMKQICLAFLMYAQDHDEVLPEDTWAADLIPYIQNEATFVCPSRPELKVGYAMNAELLGVPLNRIANPADTVLIFESDLGGDNPVGGAADVPADGRHGGSIIVGFADGHVASVPVEEARTLLARPAL